MLLMEPYAVVDPFTANRHCLPGGRSSRPICRSFERGWGATFLEEGLGVPLRTPP